MKAQSNNTTQTYSDVAQAIISNLKEGDNSTLTELACNTNTTLSTVTDVIKDLIKNNVIEQQSVGIEAREEVLVVYQIKEKH